MSDVQNPGASQDEGKVETVEKAELEAALAEKKRVEDELAQAQHTIVSLKKKPTEQKSTDIDLKAAISEAIKEAVEPVKRMTVEAVLNDELSKMTSDPKVREAILTSYENDIAKTGTSRAEVLSDLKKAFAIATAGTMKHVAGEAAHAQASMGAAGAAAGQHVQKETLTEAQINEIKLVAKLSGKSFEEAKERYLKTIN